MIIIDTTISSSIYKRQFAMFAICSALMLMMGIQIIRLNYINECLNENCKALSEKCEKLNIENIVVRSENKDLKENINELQITEEKVDVVQKAAFSAAKESSIISTLCIMDDNSNYTIIDEDINQTMQSHEQMYKDSIYDNFSEADIQYLCQMVETETFQAPFISKVYVAEVALARYRKYGGTVSLAQIVSAPGQFAYWRTGISEDTKLAVEYAYQYRTEMQNAIFFQRGYCTSWYGMPHIDVTDPCGHNFYGYDMYDDDCFIPENDV